MHPGKMNVCSNLSNNIENHPSFISLANQVLFLSPIKEAQNNDGGGPLSDPLSVLMVSPPLICAQNKIILLLLQVPVSPYFQFFG